MQADKLWIAAGLPDLSSQKLSSSSLRSVESGLSSPRYNLSSSTDAIPIGGVGVIFEERYGQKKFVVLSVVAGTAAWREGSIREGDYVVSVDGVGCNMMTLEELKQRSSGPIGSMCSLTLERPASGATYTVTLARELRSNSNSITNTNTNTNNNEKMSVSGWGSGRSISPPPGGSIAVMEAIDDMHKELRSSKSNMSKLELENKRLNTELENAKMSEQKKRIALENELEKLKLDNGRLQAENSVLVRKIGDQERSIEDLQSSLKREQAHVVGFKEKAELGENHKQNTEMLQRQLNEQSQRYQAQLAFVQQSLNERFQAELDKLGEKFSAEKKKADQTISQLETQLKEAKSDIVYIKARYAELELELQKANEIKRSLEKELEESNSRYTQLSSQAQTAVNLMEVDLHRAASALDLQSRSDTEDQRILEQLTLQLNEADAKIRSCSTAFNNIRQNIQVRHGRMASEIDDVEKLLSSKQSSSPSSSSSSSQRFLNDSANKRYSEQHHHDLSNYPM